MPALDCIGRAIHVLPRRGGIGPRGLGQSQLLRRGQQIEQRPNVGQSALFDGGLIQLLARVLDQVGQHDGEGDDESQRQQQRLGRKADASEQTNAWRELAVISEELSQAALGVLSPPALSAPELCWFIKCSLWIGCQRINGVRASAAFVLNSGENSPSHRPKDRLQTSGFAGSAAR